ncbi:MAG: hypothetical protein NTU43_06140 [Bacteroidetes bacterium]|nr:hypothetical protein [Bacteroidota bacterium]
MNKHIYIFTLLILFITVSCEKEGTSNTATPTVTCTPIQLPQQIRSINVIDPKASAGTNPIVAVFKLSQDLESYQDAKCKNKIPNCSVSLIVKNASDRKVMFDYVVNYVSGTNTWQYEGYSSIEPNGTDNIGVISSNCGWISDGTITITSGHVTYQ